MKAAVMAPAGLDAGKGVLSLGSLKPFTAEPKDDPAMSAYIDFMKRRLPNADINNVAALYGYTVGRHHAEHHAAGFPPDQGRLYAPVRRQRLGRRERIVARDVSGERAG